MANARAELTAALQAARETIVTPMTPGSLPRRAAAAVSESTATLTETNRSTSGTFSARGGQAMAAGAVAEIEKSNVTLQQMRDNLQMLYAASGTVGGLT